MNENEEILAFYWKLGVAITQWATVEFSLYELLAVLERRKAVGKKFWQLSKTGQFRAQLSLVDETVKALVKTDDHLQRWAELHKRLDNGYLKRNGLAHRVPMNYPDAQAGRRIALISWAELGQPQPADAIRVQNIVTYLYEFSALHRALDNLQHILRGVDPRYAEALTAPAQMLPLVEIRQDLLGQIAACQAAANQPQQ